MSVGIVWLRNSLRMHDNPVLVESLLSTKCEQLIFLYVYNQERYPIHNSPNRIQFLFESLIDLRLNIYSKLNSTLHILGGPTSEIFKTIFDGPFDITEVFTAYSNNPVDIEDEQRVRDILIDGSNIDLTIIPKVNTFTNIEQIVGASDFKSPTKMKDMEKLFNRTFPKDLDGLYSIDEPQELADKFKPTPENFADYIQDHIFPIEDDLVKVQHLTEPYFKGGETEALKRLNNRVVAQQQFIRDFEKPRTMSTNQSNNPQEPFTTGLSPYLSHGCLSPRQLWAVCKECYLQGPYSQPPQSLLGQLMFREMFYILSRAVPNWDNASGNPMCKEIDWGEYDEDILTKWEKGQTGFPFIDAMMRQLDTTGWMHHLGRHAVSCFLTRGQLWQHWKFGRDVFDRKLLDADWALNNGNWLWLAGVAPFSMPYFRLYNPCPSAKSSLNAETNTAEFVRYWVPELKHFPSKYIYEPHLAPLHVQEEAQCVIGIDYPQPMVDRKSVAKENLGKFKNSLKREKS